MCCPHHPCLSGHLPQVQESSFNPDLPMRTLLLLHYSSTQDSFHITPPPAPAFSHSLVILPRASFIFFHIHSLPHYSPSIIHSPSSFFRVMRLPKSILDLVPPDELAVLFIWKNSRAGRKVFTSLGKKHTCFLSPDFAQELSGAHSASTSFPCHVCGVSCCVVQLLGSSCSLSSLGKPLVHCSTT